MPHARSLIADSSPVQQSFVLDSTLGASLDSAEILKLHKQLGHAPSATIVRVCLRAGRKVVEKEVLQIIRDCGCGRAEAAPQVPRLNRYQSISPGVTVFSDIIYPDSHRQDRPAVILVCSFSRFCVTRFLANLKPISIITILLEVWAVAMGMPSTLIVDAGRSYMGPEWIQLCDLFDMRIVVCPPRAHFQCGVAERHGALVSRSFEAMKRSPILSSDFSDRHLLACVCIAKNITPLSHCPIAPATVLAGRTDFLEKLSKLFRLEETSLKIP